MEILNKTQLMTINGGISGHGVGGGTGGITKKVLKTSLLIKLDGIKVKNS